MYTRMYIIHISFSGLCALNEPRDASSVTYQKASSISILQEASVTSPRIRIVSDLSGDEDSADWMDYTKCVLRDLHTRIIIHYTTGYITHYTTG